MSFKDPRVAFEEKKHREAHMQPTYKHKTHASTHKHIL